MDPYFGCHNFWFGFAATDGSSEWTDVVPNSLDTNLDYTCTQYWLLITDPVALTSVYCIRPVTFGS